MLICSIICRAIYSNEKVPSQTSTKSLIVSFSFQEQTALREKIYDAELELNAVLRLIDVYQQYSKEALFRALIRRCERWQARSIIALKIKFKETNHNQRHSTVFPW